MSVENPVIFAARNISARSVHSVNPKLSMLLFSRNEGVNSFALIHLNSAVLKPSTIGLLMSEISLTCFKTKLT